MSVPENSHRSGTQFFWFGIWSLKFPPSPHDFFLCVLSCRERRSVFRSLPSHFLFHNKHCVTLSVFQSFVVQSHHTEVQHVHPHEDEHTRNVMIPRNFVSTSPIWRGIRQSPHPPENERKSCQCAIKLFASEHSAQERQQHSTQVRHQEQHHSESEVVMAVKAFGQPSPRWPLRILQESSPFDPAKEGADSKSDRTFLSSHHPLPNCYSVVSKGNGFWTSQKQLPQWWPQWSPPSRTTYLSKIQHVNFGMKFGPGAGDTNLVFLSWSRIFFSISASDSVSRNGAQLSASFWFRIATSIAGSGESLTEGEKMQLRWSFFLGGTIKRTWQSRMVVTHNSFSENKTRPCQETTQWLAACQSQTKMSPMLTWTRTFSGATRAALWCCMQWSSQTPLPSLQLSLPVDFFGSRSARATAIFARENVKSQDPLRSTIHTRSHQFCAMLAFADFDFSCKWMPLTQFSA